MEEMVRTRTGTTMTELVRFHVPFVNDIKVDVMYGLLLLLLVVTNAKGLLLVLEMMISSRTMRISTTTMILGIMTPMTIVLAVTHPDISDGVTLMMVNMLPCPMALAVLSNQHTPLLYRLRINWKSRIRQWFHLLPYLTNLSCSVMIFQTSRRLNCYSTKFKDYHVGSLNMLRRIS
jgi:hypothetical protein